MEKPTFIKKLLICALSLLLILGLCSCDTVYVFNEGRDLELEGYELVFSDEFEGEELDTSVWEYRGLGPIRVQDGSVDKHKFKQYYNHSDCVSVADGCLSITGKYTESEYGEGWHASSIRLKERYTYGYFEVRCIPNDTDDFWSAFWLQSNNSYIHDVSKGGVGGAEIDVFETHSDQTIKTAGCLFSSVHCNGSDELTDRIESKRIAYAYVKDLYTEFTTIGLMWTEDEYIVYVNGNEIGRSSFALGTSTDAEEVILSLCAPDVIELDESVTATFLVDYVRIYQRA